jgi:hypothetical protein
MGKRAVTVALPEDAWENTGPEEDPSARLLASLVLYGCYHHLEAYAVKPDEDTQCAAHESFSSNVDGMYAVGEPDKPFQSVDIKGREYILTMTPYCT